MKKASIILVLLVSSIVLSFGQTEKSVNNINGGMPNRISMNVTVSKQTQGATFGEKVNAGLHAAGGALAQGASLVGSALPGGAVISAAVSGYSNGKVIWQVRDAGNEFKMPPNLSDGEYELAMTMDGVSKDAAKVQVFFGLLVEGGTYKVVAARTKHDTAKNSVGNIR